MYAPRIAVVAYTETNTPNAETMGEILSLVSGIPVDLSFTKIEDRQSNLRRWAAEFTGRYGKPIDLPPAP
jgi:hypothetical protein